MIKAKALLLAALTTASLSVLAETDNAFMVKQVVSYMTPRCGSREYSSGRRPTLVEYCWNDTNRLVSALKELATTNKEYYASMSLHELGIYGSVSDLPFLYSCATNPVCGDCAIKSIIAIEGVTSNSIDYVRRYHVQANLKERRKVEVLSALIGKASEAGCGVVERAMALNYAMQYASSADKYTSWVDDVISNCESTYKFSKRRLAVLRSEFNLGLDHWEIGFVTNAINELVAYPESELPD